MTRSLLSFVCLLSKWLLASTGFVLVLSLAGLFVLAMDRDPPYKLLSVEPAEAYPGGEVKFVSRVWRDTSRDCSAKVARFITDAAGVERFVERGAFADAAIDSMERATPGKGSVGVPVAAETACGKATMRSELLYRCNITHFIRPIEVTVERKFMVHCLSGK